MLSYTQIYTATARRVEGTGLRSVRLLFMKHKFKREALKSE